MLLHNGVEPSHRRQTAVDIEFGEPADQISSSVPSSEVTQSTSTESRTTVRTRESGVLDKALKQSSCSSAIGIQDSPTLESVAKKFVVAADAWVFERSEGLFYAILLFGAVVNGGFAAFYGWLAPSMQRSQPATFNL